MACQRLRQSQSTHKLLLLLWLLFKTAGPFGLVISSQSFVKRQRGGDLYLGGRVLLMFCWMKSDTTALPSISKSSWAFSVYCWSVSSPAA